MALRILLADDSMTAQNMGKKILTDAGFDVVTVSNGAAAVKKLAESSPDIAILDVYMPGYTGLEVCEQMKSAPATAHVPVLLSVGKMEPFRPEDGMKVKADGVIIKPFEATDLVTVVDKLAERSYGPNAKSNGAVPAIPAAPAQANPEKAIQKVEANQAEPLDILQESAPVSETTAAGLQTFEAVADSGKAVAQEPGIEFTAAPKVGTILDDPLEDLVPTVLQSEAETMTDEPLAAGALGITEEQESAGALSVQEAALAAPWEVTAPSREASAPEVPEHTEISEDSDALGEIVAPAMAKAAAAAADGAEEVNWTSVEAELSDQCLDIDLEAEMQAAVQEEAVEAFQPLPAPEPPAPDETAVPFLAPLGKTSLDELDALMDQAASPEMTAAPANAEDAPIVPATEQEQKVDLLSDDELADLLAADETILPVEEAESVATISTEAPVTDAAQPESVPVTEYAIAEPETAPIPEDLVGPGEILDAASAENSTEALPAQTAAEQEGEVTEDVVSALAYYGLLDGESGGALHNPIDEADEPLFAMGDEPQIPTSEKANGAEEQLITDSSSGDFSGHPQSTIGDSVLEEDVADSVLEEVAADSVLEEVVADPILEEEVAAAPLTDAVPPTEVPLAEAAPSEAEPCAPMEEMMEEMVALAAIPTGVAVVEPPTQATDDALVNTMVERVVDRVADRLKPLLVVMVEEILAELKSRK